MKKLFRSLFIISLSVVGLSGCSLEEFFGGGKVADHIDVRDYSTEVYQNEKYTFDGKVYAVYEDNTEADVTKKSTFSTLDTSTLGKKELNVKYEDSQYIHRSKIEIEVKKYVKLTNIILPSEITVGQSRTKKITPEFVPNDASDREVTFSTGNSSVATVTNEGVITPISLGTTTLTVKSVKFPSITASATLKVEEIALDEWTVLVYMCGANLESDNGLATADLGEMLSVSGQPEDVNIVVQTGGSESWKKYGISNSYNQRYEIRNRSLNCVNNKVYNSYKGMGEQTTLQDFLEWGLDKYPANRTGLIFWNHGGGLEGCCFDDLKSGNGLTDNEVINALDGAFTTLGLTEKLEFVGYDACLMQMMEVAEFNSKYFKYQVGSQELENGTGWDYDSWVDDLYAGTSTPTVLKAICDGFIECNGGKDAIGGYYEDDWGRQQYYPADQTLSYLDLSKIDAFKTKWEALATQVSSKINNSNKSSFKNNVVGASRNFQDNESANFDCYHFLENLTGGTFDPGSTYISEAKSAILNLVGYNLVQLEGSADAHGVSFYFGKNYNSSTYSNFPNWVSLVSKVGGFGGSSWGY